MSNFKITILKYAESTISESSALYGGKKDRIWPISFFLFLFETENRKILVDAGCNSLPGFYLSRFIKPVELLKKYGVEKEEITDLIITHSHHDHIALVSEFKNARVYIQAKEYERGKRYFNDNMQIITFKDEGKITENIKAVCIGGHSVGSSAVEFIHNNKKYVIAGDECYIKECMEWGIPTGCSENMENSRNFIEKYNKGDYTVLLSHDMDILPGKYGFVTLL